MGEEEWMGDEFPEEGETLDGGADVAFLEGEKSEWCEGEARRGDGP